jgi:putative phage-type endonuclease
MEIKTNAEADREAWLASRKDAIGASEVAAILGISPWATPWEVWADKLGKLDPWAGNAQTRAGQRFESAVLDAAEDELGKLLRNVRLIADGVPLAATCDAIVAETREPVEAKTTGLTGMVYGDWGDALTDQIPEYYLTQVHAQLICTKADLGYLFALIAGRGVVRFEVEANERLHKAIAERISEWWDTHIVQGYEPDREAIPALDVVKRLRKVPNKSIALPEAMLEVIAKREAAKEIEKKAREDAELCDTQLRLALDDAEVGRLPDGREVTLFETQRKGYTVQPTSYRTLRICKGKSYVR